MCGLCSALGSGDDWTDAAGRSEFERAGRKVVRRAEREQRLLLLNFVLRHCRLSLRDWGGNSYVLTSEAGKNLNVYNLAGIWSAVDRLCDHVLDPLDPDFLLTLESGDASDV
jgi:hypothetical protein